MTEYFQTYLKPMAQVTSSIYDPNVIQSSSVLLSLYSYTQTIVGEIRKNLEARYSEDQPFLLLFSITNICLYSDWENNAFKLKLIHYQQWFSLIMDYLLEGFVAQIRQAMERAVEDDYDVKEKDFFFLR